MEPFSYASAIAGGISFANNVWSTLDAFNSAGKNFQDHQDEIDLLTNEFNAILSLLQKSTQANSLPSHPHGRVEDFKAGLARFEDGLRRVESMVTNVKQGGQGNFGRVLRAYKMLQKDKELTRLKDHITSIRAHLQTMLHVRNRYLLVRR
jgi:hypothetical protein